MGISFWLAAGIFLVSYVLIISERLHRTVVALTGAVLMVALGVLHQSEAISGVDFNTLGLLVGMMVIVGIAKDSGVFQYMALWIVKAGKGQPFRIFPMLMITVAVFSSILDNVTTALLMVPVMFVVANNLKISPKPFLMGTILFANIGGVATLIGDPTNILIGSASGRTFNDFVVNTGPAAILAALAAGFFLWLKYRRVMVASSSAQASVASFKPSEAISDRKLLSKSLIVIGLVLIGFLTHSITHLEGATLALGGAALLLLLTLHDPEEHLKHVEWTSIFFFVGLFILVAGLERAGIIELLAKHLVGVTGGNRVVTGLVVLWGSAILSAIIDNIPLVATMIPLIKTIGSLTGMDIAPLWWALSLGGNIGGNATLIGASTNVVVSGIAAREGHKITFTEYLKTALPITLATIIIFSVYLYVRYLR